MLDDLKLICVLANFVKSVQGLLRVFKVLSRVFNFVKSVQPLVFKTCLMLSLVPNFVKSVQLCQECSTIGLQDMFDAKLSAKLC